MLTQPLGKMCNKSTKMKCYTWVLESKVDQNLQG